MSTAECEPDLSDLIGRLDEVSQHVNFFDYAYTELSHETVLHYSFEKYRESGTESAAGAFAAGLLKHCFGEALAEASHEELEVERQKSIGVDTRLRPDFVLRLGDEHVAILETKLHAPANKDQLAVYQQAATERYGAELDELSVCFYKAGSYYGAIKSDDIRVITTAEINKCLKAAADSAKEGILGHYRHWIAQRIVRDKIYAHPAYQDWYFSGSEQLPSGAREAANGRSLRLWDRDQVSGRRVHWHFLKSLVGTLDELDPAQDEERIIRLLHSKGNANTSTAWVHAKVGKIRDGDASGSMFYRMNHTQGGVALEFRIYAGLKRGEHGPLNDRWAGIKNEARKKLTEVLRGGPLRRTQQEIEFPREYFSDRYNFNKQSKETSLYRVWVEHDEFAVDPSRVRAAFPELHNTTCEVLQEVDGLSHYIEEWSLGPDGMQRGS